jgi:ribokinase
MDRERASPAIAVVGSANLDVVVPVERHPRPGETVLGGDHYRASGGKGANQAAACARLGAHTRFVGCVGDDDAGRTLHDALARDGVDVRLLATRSDAPSGIALIVVAPDGENTIVVSPGANGRLDEAQVHAAELAGAAAVLLQLEIPLAAVTAAAHAAEGLVVLNPAPARALPAALLERTDVLVPNRSELATLAGAAVEPTTHDEVVDLARSLPGVSRVVITLGVEGALVVDAAAVAHVPAHPVAAVDTTAAGDSFCAALTVALTEGAALGAAAAWACAAAAVTVTSPGAQPSLPTRARVDELVASSARS